jgi:dihydropyrimidinase
MANEPIYIVHLTCDNALYRVRDARYRGQTVWAETCIQYLLLDDSVYDQPDFEGAKYVMSPPIRPAGHQEAMWNGLKSGLLQTVATDHCPFLFNGQKDMGKDSFAKIPNGGPGIQERMSLLWTHGVKAGRMTPNEFVAVSSTNAAKLFDLYPRKGCIQLGADADLLVWDPDAQSTITVDNMASEIDYTMFEGWEVQGRADTVLQRGEVVVDGGDWCGNEDDGVYLRRSPTGMNL